MKTAIVYAAVNGFEQGLDKVVKILESALEELGVEIEKIDLAFAGIPYYDGIKSSSAENIFKRLALCDGIIFACTASRLAPCGIMQTFFEHFDFNVYSNFLQSKSCFSVVISSDFSETRCEEYIACLLKSLGAALITRLSIGSVYIPQLDTDDEIKEMIAKYAEDFYRMLRQNRKFFTISPELINPAAMSSTMVKTGGEFNNSAQKSQKKKIKAEQLLGSMDLSSFNKQQEEDIDEITRLISQSYNNANKQKTVSDLYKTNMSVEAPVAHMKTCKQKTRSIIHYFQPQLAKDVNAVYQINIKGDEKFECYIEIKNNECEYYDGVHNDADVSIYAQSSDWNDILSGKYTTQKGFMTGKLKVRGNFVLLSKFDQFFKLQP